MLVQNGDDLPIVGFPLQALGGNDAGGDAALLGLVDSRGAFAIAEDDGDFRVGNPAGRHAVREGLEVGAAAAQQHAYALGHKHETVRTAGDRTGLEVHPLPLFSEVRILKELRGDFA